MNDLDLDQETINLDEALIGACLFSTSRRRSQRFPWSHQEEVDSDINGFQDTTSPRYDVHTRPDTTQNTDTADTDEHCSSKSKKNEIEADKDRGFEVRGVSNIQQHHNSRKNPAGSISAEVSAKVYADIFPIRAPNPRPKSSNPNTTPSRDPSPHPSQPFPGKRTLPMAKLGQGLRERVVHSRRVVKVPEGECRSRRKMAESENIHKITRTSKPLNNFKTKENLDLESENIHRNKRTSKPRNSMKTIEILDLEDEEFTELHVSLQCAPKIQQLVNKKKPLPNTCQSNTAADKIKHTIPKPETILKTKHAKKRKRKKSKKMKCAKVVPFISEEPDTPKLKSKEELERIAKMFCVINVENANECYQKEPDIDEDLFFRPGVWGCSFLESLPSKKEEDIVPVDIQETNSHSPNGSRNDIKVQEKKKKGNRLLNFFRKLFRRN